MPAARKRWRCRHLLAEPACTLGPVLPYGNLNIQVIQQWLIGWADDTQQSV